MRRRAASLLPSDDFLRRSSRVHSPGSYRVRVSGCCSAVPDVIAPSPLLAVQKSRSLSPPRAQWPAHPLTPLLLFLVLFPFSRLVVKLSAHCAAGELAACAHNNPVPERTGVTGNSTAPFAPNWRDDGRCGPGWQARGGVIASCDPFSMHYCCRCASCLCSCRLQQQLSCSGQSAACPGARLQASSPATHPEMPLLCPAASGAGAARAPSTACRAQGAPSTKQRQVQPLTLCSLLFTQQLQAFQVPPAAATMLHSCGRRHTCSC